MIEHPVVLHIHCVETIALAVREDGERELAGRLGSVEDARWCLVPYRRPGTPLARAIVEAQRPDTDVHVLLNHGLVVSGAGVAEAEARLERVVAALRQPATLPPSTRRAELHALAAGTVYRPAEDEAVHSLAGDPRRVALASGAPMYPDHVIFLGSETGVVEDATGLERLAAGGAPKLVVVPDRGVLLHESVDAGGALMARCLAEVVARLPEGAPVRRLTAADIHALTNWEAEAYRQALGAEARRAG